MIKLGVLLKDRRLKKGLRQKDLADHLGIAEQSYQRYELGVREPSFEQLLKICEFLDINVGELKQED